MLSTDKPGKADLRPWLTALALTVSPASSPALKWEGEATAEPPGCVTSSVILQQTTGEAGFPSAFLLAASFDQQSATDGEFRRSSGNNPGAH